MPDLTRAQVEALCEEARRTARGNPVRAEEVARRALAGAEALEDGGIRALALRALGVASWCRGDWRAALERIEEAGRAAAGVGDALLAARVRVLSIELLARLGRPDEALERGAELARALAAHPGTAADLARVDANVGNVHFQRERLDAALRAWESARDRFLTAGDAEAGASLNVNIANVLTHLLRFAEAEERYTSARTTLAAAGASLVVACIDGNLGFLHALAGEYPRALERLLSARDQFAALHAAADVARCGRQLGELYRDLNLLAEARSAFEGALPGLRELGGTFELANAELGLGLVDGMQGRRDSAAARIAAARALFVREGNQVGAARCDVALAELSLRLGGDAAAVAGSARAAAAAFRRLGFPGPALRASIVAEEAATAAGTPRMSAFGRLLRAARRRGLDMLVWRIEAARARAHRMAGRATAAIRAYERSAREIERERSRLRSEDFRIAYLDDKLRVFEELVEALLAAGGRRSIRRAFATVERARSVILAESLGGARPGPDLDPVAASALERLNDIRRELSRLAAAIERSGEAGVRLTAPAADSADALRDLESRFQEQLRRVGALIPPAHRPGSRELETELPSLPSGDETLVEYAQAGEELVAFVARGRRIRLVRGLASVEEIRVLVGRLHEDWRLCRWGDPGSLPLRRLDLLGELLLAPLLPWAPEGRLVVAPGGLLHSVPFACLTVNDRPVIERWTVSCAPSARALAACRARPLPAVRGSLALAFGGEGLPQAEAEVVELAERVPEVDAFTGGEAVVGRLPQSAELRYLHLAGHGTHRADNPAFSGLRLADDWLFAHDLARRRLPCALAVLSACRSGLSGEHCSYEMLGLPRALMQAGARGVVATLWDTEDRAARELVTQLYARLEEGAAPADALAAAQLAVRAARPHPFYWGSFVLVGDGRVKFRRLEGTVDDGV